MAKRAPKVPPKTSEVKPRNFKAYKFLVVPVIQELDDKGNVMRELSDPNQPDVCFGSAALLDYARSYDSKLRKSAAAAANNQP